MKLFKRYTPLQILIHLGAWFPLARLLFEAFTDGLTANPIQHIEQRTGRAAITLLFLSLAATPLNSLFGWRETIKRRRALGLYSFMYATIHVIIFADLDYGLAWKSHPRDDLSETLHPRRSGGLSSAHSSRHHFIRYLESTPQEKLEASASGGVLHCSAGSSALCLGQERGLLCPARRDHQALDLRTRAGTVDDPANLVRAKIHCLFPDPVAGPGFEASHIPRWCVAPARLGLSVIQDKSPRSVRPILFSATHFHSKTTRARPAGIPRSRAGFPRSPRQLSG